MRVSQSRPTLFKHVLNRFGSSGCDFFLALIDSSSDIIEFNIWLVCSNSSRGTETQNQSKGWVFYWLSWLNKSFSFQKLPPVSPCYKSIFPPPHCSLVIPKFPEILPSCPIKFVFGFIIASWAWDKITLPESVSSLWFPISFFSESMRDSSSFLRPCFSSCPQGAPGSQSVTRVEVEQGLKKFNNSASKIYFWGTCGSWNAWRN